MAAASALLDERCVEDSVNVLLGLEIAPDVGAVGEVTLRKPRPMPITKQGVGKLHGAQQSCRGSSPANSSLNAWSASASASLSASQLGSSPSSSRAPGISPSHSDFSSYAGYNTNSGQATPLGSFNGSLDPWTNDSSPRTGTAADLAALRQRKGSAANRDSRAGSGGGLAENAPRAQKQNEKVAETRPRNGSGATLERSATTSTAGGSGIRSRQRSVTFEGNLPSEGAAPLDAGGGGSRGGDGGGVGGDRVGGDRVGGRAFGGTDPDGALKLALAHSECGDTSSTAPWPIGDKGEYPAVEHRVEAQAPKRTDSGLSSQSSPSARRTDPESLLEACGLTTGCWCCGFGNSNNPR